MARLMRRITPPVWVLVLVGISLTISFIVIVILIFTRDTQEVRFLARDWQKIQFKPDIEDFLIIPYLFFPSELTGQTGGGVIKGAAQYVESEIVGYYDSSELDEALVTGAVSYTVENVWITIIDVSDWTASVEYDTDTSLYYIQLRDFANTINYMSPFERIPQSLDDYIIYESSSPETLSLTPVSTDVWLTSSFARPPRLEVLSTGPAGLYTWFLRKGCDVSIERSQDLRSRIKNQLVFQESCSTERNFPVQADQDLFDQEGRVVYFIPTEALGMTGALVLIPRSLDIVSDYLGEALTNPNPDDYLILARGLGMDYVTMTIQPYDLDTRLLVFTPSVDLGIEFPLIQIQTTTRDVTLKGFVGDLHHDLDMVEINEISEVVIGFIDCEPDPLRDQPRFSDLEDCWPVLTWENKFITAEDGTSNLQQVFSISGTATTIKIDNHKVIPTRWQEISLEMRVFILGVWTSAFGWLFAGLYNR